MSSCLIVLRGPAGAGKTTLANLVARRIAGRVARISLDHLSETAIDLFEDGKTPSTFKHPELWVLAARAGANAADAFLDAGYTVIVEGVLIGAEFDGFMNAGQPKSPLVITLLPSLETLRLRDAERPEGYRMGERVALHLTMFSAEEQPPGVLLDTSGQSPEESAEAILAILKETYRAS